MSNNLLTAREVARQLQVNVVTVNRLRKAGKLKSLKFNSRMIRYDQADVDELVQSSVSKFISTD